MEEHLYSTGQFAQLCGVKKQTLFHYDDIGLLCPARRDANGYRRYSYSQYERYLLISCLKEAGMPLKDIGALLDDRDDARREAALRLCIESLDAKIEHLKRVRSVVANTISTGTQDSAPADADAKETSLRELPERHMLQSPPLDVLSDQQLVELVADIVKIARPSVICLPSGRVLAGDLETQSHMLMAEEDIRSREKALELGFTPCIVPGGTYASIELYGSEDAAAVYGRLCKDIELLHCHPGAFFYEQLPANDAGDTAEPTVVSVQILPDDAAQADS